jgi:hypothetical protein
MLEGVEKIPVPMIRPMLQFVSFLRNTRLGLQLVGCIELGLSPLQDKPQCLTSFILFTGEEKYLHQECRAY